MEIIITTTHTPNYIFFLFAVIIVVFFYIIAEWLFSRTYQHKITLTEGYANPEYTYLPDINAPNLKITFGMSDLAIDVSCACDFIKFDSQINLPSNASTTSTPALYKKENFDTIDSTSSPSPSITSGYTIATSGPTPTPTPTYYSTSDMNPNSVDSSTAPPTSTSPSTTVNLTATDNTSSNVLNGDYTISFTQLLIYKMYNDATGYSSSSNTNLYNKMDELYGNLFDTSKIAKLSDANIAKQWNSNASIKIDDAIYTSSYFFVIQSGVKNRKCSSGNGELSSYFLQQIQQNKSSSSILLALKNAYYAIIKPRFLMNTLSNIYWNNVKSLTNSDKGTQNSILFVLNTCGGLAQTNTIATDLSENNVANIITVDTSFTMGSILLYQLMSLSFELYRFAASFNKSTTGSGTPVAIKTTVGTFISGYPQYLQKINQVAVTSPLVFFLKNLPNNGECAVVNNLQQYMNGILN
jgi:hypothetical protein